MRAQASHSRHSGPDFSALKRNTRPARHQPSWGAVGRVRRPARHAGAPPRRAATRLILGGEDPNAPCAENCGRKPSAMFKLVSRPSLELLVLASRARRASLTLRLVAPRAGATAPPLRARSRASLPLG
jgi:hypothetical protein